MTASRKSDRPAGVGRDHHIAAVAHHFLAGDGSPAGRGPGAAIVVAAAEALPATAFVAAGAARSGALADRTRWRILEEEGLVWSAGSHLPGDERVQLVPEAEFSRLREPERGLCWHLARTEAGQLDAWAAARGLPGCALPTDGRKPHLVWCVATERVAALADLEPLARLAELLEPAQVNVIVSPRAWPRRDAAAGGTGPVDESALVRLRERAAAVGGRRAGLGLVTADMSRAAAAAVITDFLRTPRAQGAA